MGSEIPYLRSTVLVLFGSCSRSAFGILESRKLVNCDRMRGLNHKVHHDIILYQFFGHNRVFVNVCHDFNSIYFRGLQSILDNISKYLNVSFLFECSGKRWAWTETVTQTCHVNFKIKVCLKDDDMYQCF